MLIRFFVALALVAAAFASVFASTASADYETTYIYWSGYAATGDYHTTGFDTACSPTSGSSAEFSGPGYVTVALIDTSGSWRRASRSNVHPTAIYVMPDTYWQAASWIKKAYCKNSTAWQISFNMYCGVWYWVQDPPHFSCA